MALYRLPDGDIVRYPGEETFIYRIANRLYAAVSDLMARDSLLPIERCEKLAGPPFWMEIVERLFSEREDAREKAIACGWAAMHPPHWATLGLGGGSREYAEWKSAIEALSLSPWYGPPAYAGNPPLEEKEMTRATDGEQRDLP